MFMLRELRKEKGLTMKELGEIIGVAESTISQYETEKREPDFETLLKLSEFFDVSTNYMLTGTIYTGEQKETPSQVSADDGLNEYLEELRTNPTQRAMFSLSKKASKEDVEAAYNIALAFLKGKGYLPDDE